MRKANTNDLFNIARLVKDLDLKEDLFNAQKGEEDIEKIGFSFIFELLAKATTKKAQQMIYEVLSGPFEMKAQDIGDMDIDKLIEGIIDCFNFKTVVNFIKRVNA